MVEVGPVEVEAMALRMRQSSSVGNGGLGGRWCWRIERLGGAFMRSGLWLKLVLEI